MYTVCDIAYVAFPVYFVWELQMPFRKKFGLMVLLGLSIITFTAAFAKALVIALALTGHFTMTGPAFGGLYLYVTTIEQCLVIMIGSIPTMKPITRLQFNGFMAIGESIVSLITRRSRSSKGSSTGGSSYEHELGPHKRLSDDAFVPPGTNNARLNTVEGNKSSNSLRKDDEITRTDDFQITYGK